MKCDINSIKRRMLVKYPFFGSIVANVDYKEEKGISTAATDGFTIFYNPDFLESLSKDEQTFIFAHEVCHIAFNHILRSEGKNEKIWNMATDAVINQLLKRDNLPLAEGGVDIAEAINYNAEQLYDILIENMEQQKNLDKDQSGQEGQQDSQQMSSGNQNKNGDQIQQQQNSSNGGSGQEGQQKGQQQNSSNGGSGQESQQRDQQQQNGSNGENEQEDKQNEQQNKNVGHDDHSMWKDAVKKHKEEQEKSGKNESMLDKLLNKNKEGNNKSKEKQEENNKLKEKQQELEKMGEKKAFDENEKERNKMLKELQESLSNGFTPPGTTTNREQRTMSNIGRNKPLVDWRYILREAIKFDVDWSYKNATIEDGVVLANLEEMPKPETEIVLDTSGSINETLLKNFLRECKNILQSSALRVGCFDTEFYGWHTIRTEQDIENMPLEGGGGTDFDVAVNSFTNRVENKIIFTDGEAYMPKKEIDAIWIVFSNTTINPKGGRVIHINREQLTRLCSYKIDSEEKGKSR